MIISEGLRRKNIAEYILYMWQTEDMIRSLDFNPSKIQEQIIDNYNVEDEMKEKIFSNLSQRAGEMLKDDLEAMGPVRLAEVEEAQQTVVRAAKELEADGTITLGKGKDDVLV